MKKLNLSSPSFQQGDLLSRSQMRNVLGANGGYGDGSGGYGGGSGGGGGGGGHVGIVCDIKHILAGGSGNYSQVDGSHGTATAISTCANLVALNPGSTCTYECH